MTVHHQGPTTVLLEYAGQKIHHPDEIGDEAVSRIAIGRGRRIELLHAGFVHDQDLVGHHERLALVVSDVDRGHTEFTLNASEFDLHLLTEFLVERGKRLVQQKQSRLEDQRPGDSNPLLLPAREFRDPAVLETGEPHQLQVTVYSLGNRSGVETAHLQRKSDVLGYRHVRKERELLEDHADGSTMRRNRVDRLPIDIDVATAELRETGDQSQKSALAAAARSQDREKLSGMQLERNICDGSEITVDLRDVRQGNKRSSIRRCSLLARSLGNDAPCSRKLPQRHLLRSRAQGCRRRDLNHSTTPFS